MFSVAWGPFPMAHCLMFKESELEHEQWFLRKFWFLVMSRRRTISRTLHAHVISVELGLAQLFQTKPQGPIYRPM